MSRGTSAWMVAMCASMACNSGFVDEPEVFDATSGGTDPEPVAPAVCGNGLVEAGERCDVGLAGDSAPCTDACDVATAPLLGATSFPDGVSASAVAFAPGDALGIAGTLERRMWRAVLEADLTPRWSVAEPLDDHDRYAVADDVAVLPAGFVVASHLQGADWSGEAYCAEIDMTAYDLSTGEEAAFITSSSDPFAQIELGVGLFCSTTQHCTGADTEDEPALINCEDPSGEYLDTIVTQLSSASIALDGSGGVAAIGHSFEGGGAMLEHALGATGEVSWRIPVPARGTIAYQGGGPGRGWLVAAPHDTEDGFEVYQVTRDGVLGEPVFHDLMDVTDLELVRAPDVDARPWLVALSRGVELTLFEIGDDASATERARLTLPDATQRIRSAAISPSGRVAILVATYLFVFDVG